MNTRTGEVFVVKQAADDEEEKDQQREANLLKELEVLQDLRHPHIVSYLGHEYVDGRLCICLEYMSGGTLRDMVNEFGPMHGELLRRAVRAVLEGLQFLHSHKPLVVHRDLKGANVLVDQWFRPMLADFGCSTFSLSDSMLYSVVGSIPWMAPEVITAEQTKKRGGGRRADVWSLGCLVLELATATNPWGKKAFATPLQAFAVIGRSDRTPPVPDELCGPVREFISVCLNRDPFERPWCHNLLQHPFVDVDDRELVLRS
jgi:serine/threonine protein kinase